ncbi:MAG: Flp pilus assembly protein CpaB [Bosea sp. (in: a-proteobacteria)]
MKPARLAVLGIALAAGAGAFLMRPAPAPVQIVDAPAPSIPTTEVLVAAVDIPLGNGLQATDLRWTNWPADSVPQGSIRKSDTPEAQKELIGHLARAQIFASEPIRRERLMKTDGSGFLSAVLPSGKRAVAITTDNRGANTAGGFILPNDRVDVIRTRRDDAASRVQNADIMMSETILMNLRVLAIGQNVQERNGEKVVVGETATLELDPRQAETIALAQRNGTISLALRSLADAKDDSKLLPESDSSLTIVRYGVTIQNVKP